MWNSLALSKHSTQSWDQQRTGADSPLNCHILTNSAWDNRVKQGFATEHEEPPKHPYCLREALWWYRAADTVFSAEVFFCSSEEGWLTGAAVSWLISRALTWDEAKMCLIFTEWTPPPCGIPSSTPPSGVPRPSGHCCGHGKQIQAGCLP